MGRGSDGLLIGSMLALACARKDAGPEIEKRAAALSAPVTVSLQDGVNGYIGTTDTQISQNAPSASAGAATTLNVDGDEPSGSGRDVAILMRWDVASIPSGSTIQAASLTVRVTNTSSQGYPLFALARPWAEASATWQQAATGTDSQSAGAMGALDREASVATTPAPTSVSCSRARATPTASTSRRARPRPSPTVRG